MTALEAALADAGGAGAESAATARLRDLLLAALRHGRDELARPRSGYETPVEVAVAAGADSLLAATPVAAALRADPEQASERAWLLAAAAVAALVDLAGLGPATRAADLVLGAGELDEGFLVLGVPAPPLDPGTLDDLAPLAFEEHAASVDRLRARAHAVPAAVLGDVALREPIGAGHPLRIAEAVARLGGRPEDERSVDEHEDAVYALLDPEGGRTTRPHEDPDPGRRVARRILQRLDGMGKWGGYHTDVAHLARGFAGNERRLAVAVGEELITAGLLAEKPSVGQRHVFLNPRRAADIRRLIERETPLPASGFRRDDTLAPMNLVGLRERISTKLHTAATLARVGVLRPHRPDRIVRTGLALLRWGPTPAAGYAASAARFPDDVAIIDDSGTLTFREVHERSNAVARALAEEGVGVGDGVAIMCRNHRGFIEATIAASKVGANAIFLNTAFSGPQLADVARREDPRVVIYDEEFEAVLEEATTGRIRVIAWHESGPERAEGTLDAMVATGDRTDLAPPPTRGKAILLTSGTTGTPKGASRSQPRSLDPAATLLSRIPLRAREKTMIAAPLFHTWGFAHFTLGMSLSSTVVLTRRFDPEHVLSTTARHECTALVVVPVMLQRIVALDDEVLRRYDLSKLRVVPVSGSALPTALANRWMNLFGKNLYNLYGSTEVAWATIATPQDLLEAPGTAGRPPRGTVVRIYDEAGVPVPPGQTGRIFVGNEMQFEGYTGGGGKDLIDGLMNSGDVGHYDAEGRLFIDGRDDDMIISGGENVFPGEVEDLLSGHDAVAEVAVFGVADSEWGERLAAVIVRRPAASLDADDVRAFVKGNLASYKVPRDVHFVDALPRTATGKVLKRELRLR